MKFYENQLFHIYNQGNNKRQVFFSAADYEFFLWKMKSYLLAYGDLVSWCLMPNHFHWQFWVKVVELPRANLWQQVDEVEYQRRVHKYGKNAQPVIRRGRTLKAQNPNISLNEAIGFLQQGYTKTINKANDWNGSLFRKECKAKDGWIAEFVPSKYYNSSKNYDFRIDNDYAYHCLRYIHNNPVIAKLAAKPADYIYSSARDYAGMRNGTLCNLQMGRQLMRGWRST